MQIVGLLDILTLALTSQPMEIETGRTWIKVMYGSHQLEDALISSPVSVLILLD